MRVVVEGGQDHAGGLDVVHAGTHSAADLGAHGGDLLAEVGAEALPGEDHVDTERPDQLHHAQQLVDGLLVGQGQLGDLVTDHHDPAQLHAGCGGFFEAADL